MEEWQCNTQRLILGDMYVEILKNICFMKYKAHWVSKKLIWENGSELLEVNEESRFNTLVGL